MTKTSKKIVALVCFAAALLTASVILFVFYGRYGTPWIYPTAITLLTVFYHFAMRLAVGELVTLKYNKREFDINRADFRLMSFEGELYKKLKVKKWIKYAITAKPEKFDLRQVTLEQLLHNMLQAELVHRIICVLSFVPILFSIPFGNPGAFIITSVFACLVDLEYVIIQRYNRPRVIRLIKKSKKENVL